MTALMDPRDELATHIPAMRAFATTLAQDSALADDLVQEALIKAWEHIDSFSSGTNMRAWLFTILRNSFYSLKRKYRHEVGDPDGHHAATLASEQEQDWHIRYHDFEKAFHALSDQHREVLILAVGEGFSYKEIAKTLDIAAGTVKSRVSRARACLAELMDIETGKHAFIGSRLTPATLQTKAKAH